MKLYAYAYLMLAACSDGPVTYETNLYTVTAEAGATENNVMSAEKSGWQQSGVLTTGDTVKSVTVQASLEESATYTVQFGINPPPPPVAPSLGVFDCQAEIMWKVNGALVRRLVSVGNGVSVSGPAQGFNVRAFDNTSNIFAGGDYTVQISVAKGNRPTTSNPPTLWTPVATVLAGGVGVVNIPQNAGVISAQVVLGVLAVGALPVKALVLQKNAAGQILKQYDPSIYTGFVPVAPNATQIEIDNLSAFSNRFEVTFGIDG